jgi:sec-independent protein translocase protein TatA
MLGGTEWLIIILAAIILLFGSRKIPELFRSLGKASAEFKRGKIMIEREIEEEAREYRKSKKKKKKTKKGPTRDPKILKTARNLGIETKGKTEEELKKEIQKALASSAP